MLLNLIEKIIEKTGREKISIQVIETLIYVSDNYILFLNTLTNDI